MQTRGEENIILHAQVWYRMGIETPHPPSHAPEADRGVTSTRRGVLQAGNNAKQR